MATVTVTPGYSWSSGEIVTPAKMNLAAAPSATSVLADGEVTNAKLASGIDASKLTTGTLPADRIGSSAITTARIADDAVTNDKLSLAANAGEIKKALNADNSPPIFACRAWVNFDGTRNEADTGASTNGNNVKIRASGNVASVLKNGTGDYTITFTTAMPDANYTLTGTCSPLNDPTALRAPMPKSSATYLASAVTIKTAQEAVGAADQPTVSVAIFR
jgi:hypothetical protein